MRVFGSAVVLCAVIGLFGVLTTTGCGGGGNAWSVLGIPFQTVNSTSGTTGPSSTGQTSGGGIGGSGRTAGDPCDETQARKFVTISMRNISDDYVHYFFVAIAFVDVDETDETTIIPTFDGAEFPDGAVCPDDIALYLQQDYIEIPAGMETAFGDYCITGPALLYFHNYGQFRVSAGTGNAGLGSAIAPAQGSNPTYDNEFTSSGKQIPVPDIILFHNPGAGEGDALKISSRRSSPCDTDVIGGAPICQRDAFYYVDEYDIMSSGTTALGVGSGRRVPSEIQGTGCTCTGLSLPFSLLAPSGATARSALCYEFLRGGRIDFIFLRDDQSPPIPQLVWKVTDSSGGLAHDFDSRVDVP
jgi:hypothetical protein